MGISNDGSETLFPSYHYTHYLAVNPKWESKKNHFLIQCPFKLLTDIKISKIRLH